VKLNRKLDVPPHGTPDGSAQAAVNRSRSLHTTRASVAVARLATSMNESAITPTL